MARPINLGKAVMEVRHADLLRAGCASRYKSECPACPDGILLVRRDLRTMALLEFDTCISCAQVVKYLDIEDLRRQERLHA